MILDLMRHWPVAKDRSFVVGDKQRDLDAGSAAGIKGYLYNGDNLSDFIDDVLAKQTA
jgi:D-glycero-D-manno-heptose 1,7-bisphosphate phosphatase